MMLDSFNNEDCLLDVPFMPEEVDSVLKKLKLGKVAGRDGVQAEHLKYAWGSNSSGLDSANL